MAPMNLDTTLGWLGAGLLSLAIGFLFGFVLEQAGFGNARKLAAQFYFYDMTVLKVMFTAIVLAMVLLSLSAGLGLVDMDRIWINPTYLWPGLLGGFILGIGFIIGGYCPGTSLVSMITLKIDGLFFVLGCLLGLTLFGEVAGYVAGFWHHAGFYGEVTLPELLGIGPTWVVLGVAAMAVGVFGVVEIVEHRLAGRPLPRLSFRRPEIVGASLLVAGALAGVLLGRPSVEDKLARLGPQLEEQLASRQFHVDPGELYDLMSGNRARLALLDVRSESDFNQFHLADARRVRLDSADDAWLSALAPETVKVVMSNGEAAAGEAWKRLKVRGVPNVYVLEGGVNHWLEVYGPGAIARPAAAGAGDDHPRYSFAAALGAAHPAARPDPAHAPARKYEPKVKLSGPAKGKSGGCG